MLVWRDDSTRGEHSLHSANDVEVSLKQEGERAQGARSRVSLVKIEEPAHERARRIKGVSCLVCARQ